MGERVSSSRPHQAPIAERAHVQALFTGRRLSLVRQWTIVGGLVARLAVIVAGFGWARTARAWFSQRKPAAALILDRAMTVG